MEGQIYPLGFDPTGTDPTNLVTDERHLLPQYQTRAQRAVILEKGHFYVDTLLVHDTSGKLLTRDIDYKTIFANGEASARTNKAVAGGILILSKDIVDRVWVDAQMVGGEYCFLGSTVAAVYDILKNDTRHLQYSNIQGRPNALTPTRHKHSLAQTFGWETFKAELERITKAIITVNKRDMAEQRSKLLAASGANTSRLEALDLLIGQHVDDKNNPHELTLSQVKLEYFDQRYIVEAAQIYDDRVDDMYLTPAAIKRYLIDQAYNLFRDHVQNTNNPHKLTLKQVSAYDVTTIDGLVYAKYELHEEVADASKIAGLTYSEFINKMRTELDASRVMNGTVNVRRLGSGEPSASTVLINGKWTQLSEVFAKYMHPKPKLLYAGTLGYEDDAFTLVMSKYSDMSAYPIGTGVLYGERYNTYNDIGPSIWNTSGILMQLAVRASQNDWTRVRVVEHLGNHHFEDASTNVWWY